MTEEGEKKDEIKAVKRQITKVFSKGTTSGAAELALEDLDEEQGDQKRVALFESRYILFFIRSASDGNESTAQSSLDEAEGHIGFIFFDISMLKVFTGVIDAASTFNQLEQFKSLLMQTKPAEIVTIYAEKSKQTIKIIKSLPVQPILSYVTQEKIFILPQTIALLQEAFSDEKINKFTKPELLALALA